MIFFCSDVISINFLLINGVLVFLAWLFGKWFRKWLLFILWLFHKKVYFARFWMYFNFPAWTWSPASEWFLKNLRFWEISASSIKRFYEKYVLVPRGKQRQKMNTILWTVHFFSVPTTPQAERVDSEKNHPGGGEFSTSREFGIMSDFTNFTCWP